MTFRPLSFVAVIALVCLTGCKPQIPPALPTPPVLPPKPPRAETKAVQAAGLVGYDGDKVRSKVDGILDQNDERNKKIADLAQDPVTP